MKIYQLPVFFSLLFLAACGSFEVSIEPLATSTPDVLPAMTAQSPTDTATVIVLPTERIEPTATTVIPSATLVLPTATQPLPAPATATPREQTIKIFLIALEDNGQSGAAVGCGDSVIPVTVTIPQTQGVLRAALEKLFSARQQFYGESGFYNALYQSELQVAAVSIEQGRAIVRLTGTISLGGACDAPRLQAQIEQTALQFSTVNEVDVFVDNVPLEDVLSSK
jgi:hypothetical protein